jgi:Ankyrin repeats (many copies)
MNSVCSILFKFNPNENINDGLKSSLFIKIDNELIRKIFSFIDQQNSRRSFLLTCRVFLKLEFKSFDKQIFTSDSLAQLGFDFFDNYICTSDRLTQAFRLKSFPTMQDLCEPKVNPPINKNHLAEKSGGVKLEKFSKPQVDPCPTTLNSRSPIFNPSSTTLNPSFTIDDTKQGKDETFEAYIVRCVKKLLTAKKDEPQLIMELGIYLQRETSDSAINQKIRTEFGGFLKLLRAHPDKFHIDGVSPEFMISLKEGKRSIFNPSSTTLNSRSPIFNPSSTTLNSRSPIFNPSSAIDDTKQGKDETYEAYIVRCVKKLLTAKKDEPQRIMEIGIYLQYETSDSAIRMHDEFGGLLNLLRAHPDKFHINGVSPEFMISLKEGKRSIFAPLSKKTQFLTKYKTTMCQHLITDNGKCPRKLCHDAHGAGEKRRNPLSAFFVSYMPTLCPTYKKEDEACAHGKGCLYSSNMMEWLYHPENYHTRLCSEFATSTRCSNFPVCDKAHKKQELRMKVTMEDPSLPLAFFARNQMWEKVIEGIARLPDTAQPCSKEVYPFSNETVLHYAAKYCRIDVISALLKKFPNLDMNPKDMFGQTPLHKTAAYAGGKTKAGGETEDSDWQQTIFLLIKNKADPFIRDAERKDAFYFAKKNTATMQLRYALAFRIKLMLEKYPQCEAAEANKVEKSTVPSCSSFDIDEGQIVHILEEILKKGTKPMLISKLGSILKFSISPNKMSLTERFEGLFNLLIKHKNIFTVTGESPQFMVDLKRIDSSF